jgi:hypothetical protein
MAKKKKVSEPKEIELQPKAKVSPKGQQSEEKQAVAESDHQAHPKFHKFKGEK